MQLLSKTSIELREETYIIQHPTEGILHCKEWLDSSGKVIDSLIRTENGVKFDIKLFNYEVEDPNLVDEIWDFIDNQ